MTEQNLKYPTHDFPAVPPAIFLMGPTASGKSGIALEIARHFPVEIVSVDSAQVYQHMNIGTAKPDAESMTAVPHHLINLIAPHERYSAAQFVSDALVAMREITERNNIPLLVGGTMLYFRALLEGLSELPSANIGIRTLIEARARDGGWPAMHDELLRLDPVSAARIQPGDSQRIQRALEICYLTDKPMSEILKKPKQAYLPFDAIRMALIPSNREVLHQRIAQRFEKMLEMGLIDEVCAIRDKFHLDDRSPSMRCVGYRQVSMYLDDAISLGTMREMALAATRQLAKRQLTWLRPLKGVKEFDCLSENLPEQVCKHLLEAGLETVAAS